MPTDVYLISDPRFTLVTGVDDTYILANRGTTTTIGAADTLIINLDQTLIIENSKKLRIDGSLENSGTVTVNYGGTCYAYNGGVINNNKTITVNSGGYCYAQSGGEINNNSGADINVTGFFASFGINSTGSNSTINNSGTVTVNSGGNCYAEDSGEINNNVGGTITVKCDGKLFKQTGGVINNSGTIINEPCQPPPIGAAAAKVHRSLFANNSLVFYKSHSGSSSTGSGGVGNSRIKRRKT